MGYQFTPTGVPAYFTKYSRGYQDTTAVVGCTRWGKLRSSQLATFGRSLCGPLVFYLLTAGRLTGAADACIYELSLIHI